MRNTLLAVLLITSSSAFAANITVLNSDFEAQPLADGSFTNNIITSWVGNGATDYSFGAFNPLEPNIIGTTSPDNNQTAYVNSGSISQLLSESVTANTIYDLSVDVFSRFDLPFPGYTVELLAGNVVVATGSLVIPDKDTGLSLTSTASFSSVAADNSILGQFLSVRLSSNGVQTNFDNVQLTTTAVPEAETYAMLLAGLGLLGVVKRRRKQT